MSQDIAGFASTLAMGISTNASLVRSPFAGQACRTDELLEL